MPWERFQQLYQEYPELQFAIDVSRVDFPDRFLAGMAPHFEQAHDAMLALEKGAIANPDEGRMVGHYWLRAPELAPSADIRDTIETTFERIKDFAAKVHAGHVQGQSGPFRNLLVIGIGGSALGPQFVADALGGPGHDKLRPFFFDNTDPDGIRRTLAQLDGELGQTLAIVISKSGSTAETRNGMLEAEAAWKAAGLAFGGHAVAVTGDGSKLAQYAAKEGWLETFPMFDWVGGRTSETAAVGLLPAALQGLDIDSLLRGAAEMDAATRSPELLGNPAAILATAWYFLTGGRGEKDMVILPYKDRLQLFSKYLQQLVMESLGKEKDLDGNTVHQGIAVYGNKGSTDQHAYVQQLREGVPNFYAVFIEVLRDLPEGGEAQVEVEPGTTPGDYLNGFFLGTREALYEKGRQSITLTIEAVDAAAIGRLIALFERAVGFYANYVNINAYHQPGVEAGKKAAATNLSLMKQVEELLRNQPDTRMTAEKVAGLLSNDDPETIFKLLCHLAANPEKGIVRVDPEAGTGARFAGR